MFSMFGHSREEASIPPLVPGLSGSSSRFLLAIPSRPPPAPPLFTGRRDKEESRCLVARQMESGQIEKREEKDPDNIDEVPVEPADLHR